MAKPQKSTKKVILSDDEDNHKETSIKFQMTQTGDISKLIQNQLLQTKISAKINPSKTKELWQPKEKANTKKIQIDPMDQKLLRQKDKISRIIMENAQRRVRAGEHSPEKTSDNEGKKQSMQASPQSNHFQSTKSPLKSGDPKVNSTGKKGLKSFYDPHKMFSIKDFSYAGLDSGLDYEQNKDHLVSFQHYIRRLMQELHTVKPYNVRETITDHFQVLDKQKEREKSLKIILEQNKFVDAKNPSFKGPQKRIPVKLTVLNEDGTTQVISHMLNPDRLQEQLVRKYSRVLSSGKYTDDKVIQKMAKDYNNMLNVVRKGGFKVSIPKKYKPRLQDYNDYYMIRDADDVDDSAADNEYLAMNEVIGNQIEEELNPDDDVLSVMRTSSSEGEGDQLNKISKKASVKFKEDEIEKYENEQNAPKDNQEDESPQSRANKRGQDLGKDEQEGGNDAEENLPENGDLRETRSRRNDEDNNKLDNEEKPQTTVETQEGENLDHYVQAYENAKPQLPNIIDQLLEAPSILEAKIDFRKNIGEIPKIPEDLLFENEEDKKIYEVIFRWQYQLEKELKEEEKNLKRADSEEDSDESSAND